MTPIISVSNLRKEFRDVTAVDGLSFEVQAGEVYGFLGQNGAGKSTTIRMLLTLVRPTSGHIEMFGMDLVKHRYEILRQVGAIIERPDLYKYLTGMENLKLFAAMSGVRITNQQFNDQMEMVGLSDRAGHKVKTYSQGMKQRLGIATALIHNPKLIILDEPTNGLDPQGIADIRNLILHLSRDLGKTVLVSSHLLSEMELIADSMIIIDKGKKIVQGKYRDLVDPAEVIVEIRTTDNHQAYSKLGLSIYKSSLLEPKPDRILIKTKRASISQLLKDLVAMDVNVLSFQPRNSLEDYFLSLTSGQQHVEAFKD